MTLPGGAPAIAHDPSPHGQPPVGAFAHYVDPAAMRQRWRGRLPALLGASLEVSECRVLYARARTYSKPASWQKSFLCVCYELEVGGGATAPWIYGRAYLDGRSRIEFGKLETAARGEAVPCRARLVPELDMIVWNFPDDPRLPQLRELADGERVLRHLPYASLPFSGPEAIRDIKTQIVRYRPEQRCILRYDIGYGPEGDRLVLFAKVFGDDTGEQVLERMRHCRAAARVLGVRVARPLAYCAEQRTVWQEELSGAPLTEALGAAGTCRAPLAAIGRCLARLHRAALPMTQTVTRESRLADARKKARKLGQAFPRLAGVLEGLIGHAQTELSGLAPAPECVIHGDMHFDQFRLANDGVLALFDFDEWTRGDPAQDLADLIVDAHLRGLGRHQAGVEGTRLPGMIRVLLDSYRQGAAWTADESAIAWHACLQLITKAYRTCIQQEPRWQERAPEMVALATRFAVLGAATKQD
ncbi:MAG: phosphotransferase [Burkholderiales bacterium]